MDWRIGVAIGDQVLDLRRAGLIDHAEMDRLMGLQPADAARTAPGAVRRPEAGQRRRKPPGAPRCCR